MSESFSGFSPAKLTRYLRAASKAGRSVKSVTIYEDAAEFLLNAEDEERENESADAIIGKLDK